MNITYFDCAETFVSTKISDGLTIENNLTPWLKNYDCIFLKYKRI